MSVLDPVSSELNPTEQSAFNQCSSKPCAPERGACGAALPGSKLWFHAALIAAGVLLGTACGDSDSPADSKDDSASSDAGDSKDDSKDEDDSNGDAGADEDGDAGTSSGVSRSDEDAGAKADSDDQGDASADDGAGDNGAGDNGAGGNGTGVGDAGPDDGEANDGDNTASGEGGTADNGADTSSADEGVRSAPANTGESWTVLVYMVADNNLEPFAIQDLTEMMDVDASDDLTILVQSDRAQGYTDEAVGSLGDWTSTKRLKVAGGSIEELDDLGELNMGESSNLSDFVQWGLETAPSDRTALIFWDHGGGWNSFGGDESDNHDDFNLLEIQSGLEEGLSAVGRDTRLDLIGFDACLMATYETASAMAPYAEYLLASQELEPGNGWNWRSLQLLVDEPTSDAADLGRRIIKDYAAHEAADPSITLSLSHLGGLGSLRDALADLSSELTNTDPSIVGRVRAKANEFAQDIDLVDLQSLVTALAAEDDSLSDASDALVAAMGEVVVKLERGAHRQFSNGLSIYFPKTSAKMQSGYADVPGLDEWRGYLSGFYEQGSAIEVELGFLNPDHIGTLGIDEDGFLLLQGDLAPGTADVIVDATANFGVVVDDVLLLLGDSQADWDDSIAQGYWDLTALLVEQDGAQTLLYYSEAYSGDGTLSLTVPFFLNDEYLIYELILDSEYYVVSEEYYQQVGGAWGAVSIAPGDLLYPAWDIVDDNGDIQTLQSPDPIDPNAEFGLSFEPVEAGTDVFMLLQITDFGGNSDFVYNTGTL